MIEEKRVALNNGVRIYPFSSVEELIGFVKDKKKILVAINAEKILHADDQTRNIINNNIGYCDGVGAVLAVKKHNRHVVKIAGCELWLKIVESMQKDSSFYLVGSTQEVIDATIAKLRNEFPDINIVGYRNGFIRSEQESTELLDDIEMKKPDIVFVAMGSPKQELLMMEMQKRHQALYQGLGGSFDVYVGKARRAPKWWVDHNLEFAYRLFQQPARIKRQIFLFKFVFDLIVGKI